MTSSEVESYYHQDDLYQAYMDCLSRAIRRAFFYWIYASKLTAYRKALVADQKNALSF